MYDRTRAIALGVTIVSLTLTATVTGCSSDSTPGTAENSAVNWADAQLGMDALGVWHQSGDYWIAYPSPQAKQQMEQESAFGPSLSACLAWNSSKGQQDAVAFANQNWNPPISAAHGSGWNCIS